jgi:hypothetical protein
MWGQINLLPLNKRFAQKIGWPVCSIMLPLIVGSYFELPLALASGQRQKLTFLRL